MKKQYQGIYTQEEGANLGPLVFLGNRDTYHTRSV